MNQAAAHVSEILDVVKRGDFIALDTNILIEVCDDGRHHDSTVRLLQKLVRAKDVRLIYFLASKLELGEYFRRKFLTEYLRKHYRSDNVLFGGTGVADQFCLRHPKLERESLSTDVLTDREIKEIRQRCFENYEDASRGVERWQQVCTFALKTPFAAVEQRLADIGISYQNVNSPELFPEGARPEWREQEKLIIQFGLSSADAAILNMARAGARIHGIITNDIDIIAIFQTDRLVSGIRCYTFLHRHLAKVS